MKKYRIIFITSGEFVEFNEEDMADWSIDYKGLDLMIRTACCVFYFNTGCGRECPKCPWNLVTLDECDKYDELEYLLEEIE